MQTCMQCVLHLPASGTDKFSSLCADSGGLYSTAAGLKLAGKAWSSAVVRVACTFRCSESNWPAEGVDGDLTDPTLKTPGYKLLEQADWDYNSTVYLLNDFIAEVSLL